MSQQHELRPRGNEEVDLLGGVSGSGLVIGVSRRSFFSRVVVAGRSIGRVMEVE